LTSTSNDHKLMIMDACVLIDFLKSDPSVLQLIVNYVGPIYVISPIVDEVNDIEDENELLEYGLLIIEPEIEDAYSAASRSGPISFQDQLCLLTAKRFGFTCVTNDQTLRKSCEQNGVPLLWGLEILILLHKSGGINAKEAKIIALAIQNSNPRHITKKIISRFLNIIQEQDDMSAPKERMN
jgi:hypothetical protein